MTLINRDRVLSELEYYQILDFTDDGGTNTYEAISHCIDVVRAAEEIKSSKSWTDALESSFEVSRRTAKDMYHALCLLKARDNFRKKFDN